MCSLQAPNNIFTINYMIFFAKNMKKLIIKIAKKERWENLQFA